MEENKLNITVDMWDKFSRVYDSLKKSFVRQIAEFNLTAPQFGVLQVLHENGSMPLKKISKKLFVTGANITCVVDNLEKDDLVTRVHSKSDRRIILAELTEKGKNKFLEILPEYEKHLMQLTEKLSDEEKQHLSILLDKLNHN